MLTAEILRVLTVWPSTEPWLQAVSAVQTPEIYTQSMNSTLTAIYCSYCGTRSVIWTLSHPDVLPVYPVLPVFPAKIICSKSHSWEHLWKPVDYNPETVRRCSLNTWYLEFSGSGLRVFTVVLRVSQYEHYYVTAENAASISYCNGPKYC